MNTTKYIENHLSDWISIRRDIHAHPELCFEEFRTSDLIAKQLEKWHIETHRGIGATGVVGVIQGKPGPRSIAFRADMDALPMQEFNTFEHTSRHKGKMHACGHDGHVAMLLAAAQLLAKNRNFHGRVILIFQPAEEGGGGAQRMIEDGLFQRFPVDHVFAMHNWPGLPVGTFAVREGPMMASSNEFHIKIRGKGTHAAMPNLGIDPVMVACQIALGFQPIVSRLTSPFDPTVISITQIHAGEALNVIPEFAEMAGTVRTFKPTTLDMIEQQLEQISNNIAQAYGASIEFSFHRNYPPVINDTNSTQFVKSVLQKLTDVKDVFDNLDPTMGAEDFAFMLQTRPGSYFWIGNGDGEHREVGHGLGPCNLHNPSYDFNDELIPLGAKVWVAMANDWLKEQPVCKRPAQPSIFPA